jgi:hypothetical protein
MMRPERIVGGPGRRMGRRTRRSGFSRSRAVLSRARWWGIGTLAVGTLSLIAYVSARGTEPPPEPRLATEPHANSKAGYSFSYPPKWRLREKGSVARVVSPDSEVSISFGLGGKGDLRAVATRLVEELEGTYRKVALTGFQLTLIDGEPAVSFTGSAVSTKDVPLRFQAISVAGPERNYAVAVFVAADATPEDVLPPIQEILDSFRFIP